MTGCNGRVFSPSPATAIKKLFSRPHDGRFLFAQALPSLAEKRPSSLLALYADNRRAGAGPTCANTSFAEGFDQTINRIVCIAPPSQNFD